MHRGLVFVLAVVTAVLVVADLVVKAVHRWVVDTGALLPLLDVGREGNVPSWWNSGLLLLVAGSAALVGLLSQGGRRGWVLVALAAVALSLDEAVEIHERAGIPARAALDALGLDLATYAWILPGAVVGAVGLVLAVRWSAGLPRRVRRGFTASVGLYLLGALGVESVNGWTRRQEWSEIYLLGTAVEESLEMGACILAAATFLGMLRLRSGESGPELVRAV